MFCRRHKSLLTCCKCATKRLLAEVHQARVDPLLPSGNGGWVDEGEEFLGRVGGRSWWKRKGFLCGGGRLKNT